ASTAYWVPVLGSIRPRMPCGVTPTPAMAARFFKDSDMGPASIKERPSPRPSPCQGEGVSGASHLRWAEANAVAAPGQEEGEKDRRHGADEGDAIGVAEPEHGRL